jgi:hypothetical protein
VNTDLKFNSTAFKILRFFAHSNGLPGVTVGDIGLAIGAHVGTAIHQRMTLDLIGRGWDIRHPGDDVRLYWMPWKERARAKAYCRAIERAHRVRIDAKAAARIARAQREAA